tara:strand:+ start:2473 stop:3702 length:1230 start_codon:yes stop_codon:yes gene_type:complete
MWWILLLCFLVDGYEIQNRVMDHLCDADFCLTHRYEETRCLFPNESISYRYRGNADECFKTTIPLVAETIEHVQVSLQSNQTLVEYEGGFRVFDVVNVSSVSVYHNMMVFGIAKEWSLDTDAHIFVYENFTSSANANRVNTFNPNMAFIDKNDHYGTSVDVGKYFVVVGAPKREETQSATPRLGAAFLYPRNVLVSNNPVELLAPGRPNDQPYGLQVMTVENRVFVGWGSGLVMFQCIETLSPPSCTVEKRFTRLGFARAIQYYVIGPLIFDTSNMRKELIEINELGLQHVIEMNETAVLYNGSLLLSCAPGYTGVNVCVACEENFYAPHIYADECLPCPDGFVSGVASTTCQRPKQPVFIDRSWGDVAHTAVMVLVVGSFLIVLSSCFFASCYKPKNMRIRYMIDSGL